MAVSRNTGHSQLGTFWKRVFGQLSRYDLVLTVIPFVFALAAVANVAFSVPFLGALAASAIVSVVVLADALFINPPVDTGTGFQ